MPSLRNRDVRFGRPEVSVSTELGHVVRCSLCPGNEWFILEADAAEFAATHRRAHEAKTRIMEHQERTTIARTSRDERRLE